MLVFVERPRCDICGSSSKKILIARRFADPSVWNFLSSFYSLTVNQGSFGDALYEVAECDDCSFRWQTRILDDHGMQLLYTSWITRDASLMKKAEGAIGLFSSYAREAELTAPLFGRRPHTVDVLDFGMGWGYWCFMMQAFGYNVTGQEISDERLEYARSRGIRTVGSLDELSPASYDFINCEQVFEHIPDPVKQLRSLATLLKPDGIVRINVPNGNRAHRLLQRKEWKAKKDALHPLEHINCYTTKSLKRLATESGLTIIPQPLLIGTSKNPLTLLRGLASACYRTHFSTLLFFRKSTVVD